jgi:formate-dependent nitrite reductase membrane component NrfD
VLQVIIDIQLWRERGSVETLERPARVLAPVSALLGLVVAGYTGVLLAATAVPIWSKRPWLLGPLFLTSATSSGTAAVTLASSLTNPSFDAGEAKLHRFEAYALIAESTILTGWIYALGPTAKPVVRGTVGSVLRHVGVGAGMVVPHLLAIGSLKSRNQRNRLFLTRAASILTLVGGFAVRYAVVQAGRDSADDPQATFDMTGV